MGKLRYVLWDWNGTLLDDVDVCIHTMNEMLARRGISPLLDRDAYREIFGFPVIRYYEKAGLDLEREPFERLAEEYIEGYLRDSCTCALYPGAVTVLDYLKEKGTKQCILSATKTEHLMSQLEPFSITGYFDSILGIGDALARSKVDVGVRWARENSIDPDDMVLVGDTIHDYEVAEALGCRCLLIANGHQSRRLLSTCACEIADTISDVIKLDK